VVAAAAAWPGGGGGLLALVSTSRAGHHQVVNRQGRERETFRHPCQFSWCCSQPATPKKKVKRATDVVGDPSTWPLPSFLHVALSSTRN
jgi:hypothetical protein